jgi:hypothetical protein
MSGPWTNREERQRRNGRGWGHPADTRPVPAGGSPTGSESQACAWPSAKKNRQSGVDRLHIVNVDLTHEHNPPQ